MKRKNYTTIFVLSIILISSLLLIYKYVHIYKPATCIEAETCYICGKERNEALGHEFSKATCSSDSICIRCGLLNEKALGHDFISVSDTLDICSRCHKEEGYLEELTYDGTYLLYCDSFDKVLYQNNPFEQLACASITKLVTSAIALEYLDDSEVIEVGNEIYMLKPNSSRAWLNYGDRLSVLQLIEACLIPSGNDAAYVFAKNVSLKINPNLNDKEAIEYFVSLMNEYVKKMGCDNTIFYSPDGYDLDKQHTTCEDLIKISKNALSFEIIKETVKKAEISEISEDGFYYYWINTNQFLHEDSIYYDENVTGLKTGTTPLANNCIVVTYHKDELDYILVVLNMETDEDRYELASSLLEKIKQ